MLPVRTRPPLTSGVYAADIGYLSSYDKTQEAIDYLEFR